MTKYQFDFSRFTLAHLVALSSGFSPVGLSAIHDLTVGGIYHLRAGEITGMLADFIVAYREYANSIGVQLPYADTDDEGAPVDDSAVRDMLKDIKGL